MGIKIKLYKKDGGEPKVITESNYLDIDVKVLDWCDRIEIFHI